MKHRKKSTHPNRKTTNREPISKKDRFYVLNRDNFTCRYCGQSAPDVVLHADHVKPVAKGGSNSPDNLVAACSACNGGKGATEILQNLPTDRIEFYHSQKVLDSFDEKYIKNANMCLRLLFEELYRDHDCEIALEFMNSATELVYAKGSDNKWTKLANNILSEICKSAHLSDIEESDEGEE